MHWFWNNLQKVAILLFRVFAFTLMAFIVWAVAVEIPWFVRTLYLFSGDPVQTINPYLFIALYFLIPIRLSFYIAIITRVLLVVQDYLQVAQGCIIPPYPADQPSEKDFQISWDEVQKPSPKKLQNVKWAFGMALVWLVIVYPLYVAWIQWHPQLLASILRQLPTDVLLSSISSVLQAPVGQFIEPSTGEMNASSLVGTFFLVWIPMVPLTVGFLNLNSYLYDITRKMLFHVAKGAWNLSATAMALLIQILNRSRVD